MGMSIKCPIVASIVYDFPKNLLIVLTFAGDSTIIKLSAMKSLSSYSVPFSYKNVDNINDEEKNCKAKMFFLTNFYGNRCFL